MFKLDRISSLFRRVHAGRGDFAHEVVRMVKIKRAYEPPAREDGTRVLVDRLWPRGMKKSEAHIDEWLKDIAPSNELRAWYGHEPAKWKSSRNGTTGN